MKPFRGCGIFFEKEFRGTPVLVVRDLRVTCAYETLYEGRPYIKNLLKILRGLGNVFSFAESSNQILGQHLDNKPTFIKNIGNTVFH